MTGGNPVLPPVSFPGFASMIALLVRLPHLNVVKCTGYPVLIAPSVESTFISLKLISPQHAIKTSQSGKLRPHFWSSRAMAHSRRPIRPYLRLDGPNPHQNLARLDYAVSMFGCESLVRQYGIRPMLAHRYCSTLLPCQPWSASTLGYVSQT